jgi:hypothetical protein
MILLPADVVFTRGASPVTNVVLGVQRRPGEKRTTTEHCGVISEGGHASVARLVESLPEGTVNRQFAPAYMSSRSPAASIWRLTTLTEEQRKMVVAEAVSWVHRPYGWQWPLAHFGDWLIGSRWFFRGMVRNGSNPDCSGVLGMAFDKIGYRFVEGIRPDALQPDDAWDHVTSNIPPWQCIGAV